MIDMQTFHVVAQSGQPAFTFTPANVALAQGGSQIRLIENGISSAPAFSGFSGLVNTSGSYTNTAGIPNTYTFADDGWTPFYTVAAGSTLPTPTTFVAALNGLTLTITFAAFASGGLAAVTPPLSAFTMNVIRTPGPGQQIFNPMTLASINSVNAGDTTLILKLPPGSTFLSGDSVTLSYRPPATNPLEDQASSLSDKFFAWDSAVCTVQ
jgi:hypothetical protein